MEGRLTDSDTRASGFGNRASADRLFSFAHVRMTDSSRSPKAEARRPPTSAQSVPVLSGRSRRRRLLHRRLLLDRRLLRRLVIIHHNFLRRRRRNRRLCRLQIVRRRTISCSFAAASFSRRSATCFRVPSKVFRSFDSACRSSFAPNAPSIPPHCPARRRARLDSGKA